MGEGPILAHRPSSYKNPGTRAFFILSPPSMDHETASLLTTLRVAGAPLLASLPLELLYGIFAAGGLEEAVGWRFEEQRKTDRSLIVDAVCMGANFTDNTHAEGDCFRLEGRPAWILRSAGNASHIEKVRVSLLEVRAPSFILSAAYGYNTCSPQCGGPRRWHWSADLDLDPLFQSLLKTKQMQEWLKHCEEHFCK